MKTIQPTRQDHLIESTYIVIVLMWFAGATLYYDFSRFEEVTVSGVLDRSGGNRRVQVVTLTLLLFSLLFVALNIDKALTIVGRNKALFGLLGLTYTSVLWSILPGTSARRAIALTLTTAFAIFVVQRVNSTRFLQLTCAAIFGTAILSLILIILVPDFAITSRDGAPAWRGIWGNKNSAGKVMAMGMVCFLCLALTQRKPSAYAIVGLLICTGILVMTQSRTPLVAGLCTCAFIIHARILPGRQAFSPAAWLTLGFISCIVSVATILPFTEQIFGMLGRDLSLTNRTNIWASAIAVGATRPLFGFGFRAFWTDAGVNATSALHFTGADLGNGHSGYVDLWLELGVLGIIAFAAMLVVFVRRFNALGQDPNRSPADKPIWIPAVVIFVLIYSIAEKVILNHTELLWFLVMMGMLYSTPRDATDTPGRR